MRNKISIVIIVILLALFFGALGYIGYDKFITANAIKEYNSANQGFQQGYQQAILQIMQQASTCQSVPLYVRNETFNMTLNIVAVDCLQRG